MQTPVIEKVSDIASVKYWVAFNRWHWTHYLHNMDHGAYADSIIDTSARSFATLEDARRNFHGNYTYGPILVVAGVILLAALATWLFSV